MTTLKDLSDEDYVTYALNKAEEGFNYFSYSNRGEVFLGKLGNKNSRIFKFNKGVFISKSPLYTAYALYDMKAEMINEKQFIKLCKILKIDDKYVNEIINLKPRSIDEFEGIIPPELLTDLFLEGTCGEDINLEDLLH